MNPTEAVISLLKLDLSEAKIARIAGTSQPTIHRVSKGGNCLFETGQRLIELARDPARAVELANAAHANRESAVN